MDDLDLQAEFDVRAYDKDCSTEKKWQFTQEHYDQGLIANPDIVGKNYDLNNRFPFALRLSRFVPVQDHMIYTTRKLTQHPWEYSDGDDSEFNSILYVPKTQEELHQRKPEGATQEYTLRVTDFIGPETKEFVRDQIHTFPEKLDDLKTCSAEKLQKHAMKKVAWREYYDNGVLEGLTFTNKSDEESMGFGETKRCGNRHNQEITDEIKKISVIYDERWITGIKFYDCRGEQTGKTLGQPLKKGRQGEVNEVFIGLLPEEKIVGVRIMEASDPGDGGADMLGKISFILSAPAPKGKDIHWSYAGKSVNYECSKRFADQVGELLTKEEGVKLMKERGAIFPGEDQWAAVAGDDWIQMGDLHHEPGTLHSKFGPPGWGPKTENFVWRNCFLWKDTETSLTAEKEYVEVIQSVKENEEKTPFDKVVPKDLFLSTIKVLKYFQDKEPELVKEILCESNLKATMDYGPSVAYFGKAIYYFKRHFKGEKQSVQMWKYSFDNNTESQVTGKSWEEEDNTETKIQFFEQPNSENYQTEEEWLNNTYVSRQKVLKETTGGKSAYQIYCLGNTGHAVYDSGSIKIRYLSKLVLLRDSDKMKVYTWTIKERYVFTLPKQDETFSHSESDLEKTISVRKNETDYHQDWPFELRKSEINLGGTPTAIYYFMVPCHGKEVIFEVMGLDDDKQEQKARKIINQKISAGIFHKNKHSEATTQIDRSYDTSENVTFPAIIPRRFVKEIFEPTQHVDVHRKLYESPDGRSIMMYCFAGRDILVATLKADSKYKNVQDVFAALDYDPTPDDVKITQLQETVAKLQAKVDEQLLRIEVLEGKK